MGRFIALLRGVNVSGKNKVNMKELKSWIEQLAYTDVETYIQSGNIVFTSSQKNVAILAQEIHKSISEHLGLDIAVIILSPAALRKIIEENPFSAEKNFDERNMYLCFLQQIPPKEKTENMKHQPSGDDRFYLAEQVVYLYVPGGYGNTKINNNFFENKLKVAATTRNWKTTQKLLEMADATQ